MQHLEVSGVPVLYIGRTVPKGYMPFLFITCLCHAPPTYLGVCISLSFQLQDFLCPPTSPSQQASHCPLEHCPTKYDSFVILGEAAEELQASICKVRSVP